MDAARLERIQVFSPTRQPTFPPLLIRTLQLFPFLFSQKKEQNKNSRRRDEEIGKRQVCLVNLRKAVNRPLHEDRNSLSFVEIERRVDFHGRRDARRRDASALRGHCRGFTLEPHAGRRSVFINFLTETFEINKEIDT